MEMSRYECLENILSEHRKGNYWMLGGKLEEKSQKKLYLSGVIMKTILPRR